LWEDVLDDVEHQICLRIEEDEIASGDAVLDLRRKLRKIFQDGRRRRLERNMRRVCVANMKVKSNGLRMLKALTDVWRIRWPHRETQQPAYFHSSGRGENIALPCTFTSIADRGGLLILMICDLF